MTIEVSSIVYPFYCFWFFKPFLKMNVKEFSFSCVSLFNYQGSCHLTAPIFYHIVFSLSSTFLKSFLLPFGISALLRQPHYIITSASFCQELFLNFFQSFSTASLSFCDSLTIISFVLIFVNTFLFFNFFVFVCLTATLI